MTDKQTNLLLGFILGGIIGAAGMFFYQAKILAFQSGQIQVISSVCPQVVQAIMASQQPPKPQAEVKK